MPPKTFIESRPGVATACPAQIDVTSGGTHVRGQWQMR